MKYFKCYFTILIPPIALMLYSQTMITGNNSTK